MSEHDGAASTVVLAGYRARGSDTMMIRWVTPIVVVVLVVFGVVAGNSWALTMFLAGAIVVAVRWAWVTVVGPRPLALAIELTESEMRVKTLRRLAVVTPDKVHSLAPAGFRPRPRGPRALVTDAGTYTLYPDGPGFEELLGTLRRLAPRLRVEEQTGTTAAGRGGARSVPESLASAGSSGPSERLGDGADLAPGVVAVAVVGSQALADRAVDTLEAGGVTALALPSASGLGGVRITVAEDDRTRAEEILGGPSTTG